MSRNSSSMILSRLLVSNARQRAVPAPRLPTTAAVLSSSSSSSHHPPITITSTSSSRRSLMTTTTMSTTNAVVTDDNTDSNSKASITTTATNNSSAASWRKNNNNSTMVRIVGSTIMRKDHIFYNMNRTIRLYHASSATLQAMRRRRRNQTAVQASDTKLKIDDDDDDEYDGGDNALGRKKIRRITDPTTFATVSTELLDTIYAALSPLAAINDPYFLSRDFDPEMGGGDSSSDGMDGSGGGGGGGEYILLDLGSLHGQYTLQVDLEQALIQFQSPISGIVQYYKDADDGEWRSVDDGHILQGLLVRDLIRQIKGVPKL